MKMNSTYRTSNNMTCHTVFYRSYLILLNINRQYISIVYKILRKFFYNIKTNGIINLPCNDRLCFKKDQKMSLA